ncbi:MAG: FHA domain-containing protein [Chloroflexota bacterium]
MHGFRLARLDGEQAADLWTLWPDRETWLGRSDPERGAPDIDLSPDGRVSRSHARIWSGRGAWWIEDAASTSGTRVGGQEIRGSGPVRLESGAEIRLGGTALLFAPPTWRRLRGHGLVVDLEVTPAVNLALVHCGLPVVSQLTVRNWSARSSRAARLTLALAPDAAEATVRVPALAPGERVQLQPPALDLDYASLESRMEAGGATISLALDDQPLDGDRVDCRVLAHNEWSCADDHRLSLAAFILPNHPLVAEVALDVVRAAPVDGPMDRDIGEPAGALVALYQHLAERWHLDYQLEPPHWDHTSQKIRLPHQVLFRPEQRAGQGTCLDLALLFAGCLEHLGFQPLVAILDMGSWRHALVGCWRGAGAGLGPLILDARRLREEGIWVDPTGCTRDPACRLPFDDARREAVAHLEGRPLLFGLDVFAARNDGVVPLPFAGAPRWSAAASEALAAARVQAERARTDLSTVPLLLGLLSLKNGLTREVVGAHHDRVDSIVARLAAGLPARPQVVTSAGYRDVLGLAQAQAKDEGSPLILEDHLLHAVLRTPSSALDRALSAVGITRHELLATLRSLRRGGSAGRSSTHTVRSDFLLTP